MENRVLWADYTKVIGIYLMVLGHGNLPVLSANFIYLFHMPLFFILSGYLFNKNKYPDYWHFLKNKFQTLLVPYLIFNVITFSLWIMLSNGPANKGLSNIDSYRSALGIFYGNGIDNYLRHAVPLWFIICLFTVEQLYYVFFINQSLTIKFLLMGLFAIIGYCDYVLNIPRLPWGFNIALSSIVFYAFGNVFKNHINRFMDLRPLNHVFYCILLCFLTYIIMLYNGRVDINARVYGNNYFAFYLGGIVGSIMLFSLARLFSAVSSQNRLINFIARNTIPIIAFNILAYHFIKSILLRLPVNLYGPIKIRIEKGDLFIYALLSFIVLIILLPLMYCNEKLFKFLFGRKRERGFLKDKHLIRIE